MSRKFVKHKVIERWFRMRGIVIYWCGSCFSDAEYDSSFMEFDIGDHRYTELNCGIQVALYKLEVLKDEQ